AVQLAHELEAVRDAWERAERLGDLRIRDAGSACGGGCGGCVLAVVHAADERLGWERVVGGELDPVEAETSRDDPGAGALEDAELRVAVCLEGAVAVEMVRLEVQEHCDLA